MSIWRSVLRRSEVEREMDLEMQFHFDRMVEEYRARGMTLDEARRQARLDFGGMGQVKDDARDARMADRLERAARGLRMAVRNLRRSPGFTTVAILTLALGIGVNTLMFSLFDQLLVRELPVRDPRSLVLLHGNFITPGMYRGNDRLISFSWPKYRDFRDRCDVFSGVAARFPTLGSLEYRGSAERITAELVSGNYFEVLGVSAALGRVLTPDDAKSLMANPLVVLSYSYWQRRFGGAPDIVGQQVRVNGLPMTVIGVSAAGYHSIDRGNDEDIRVPITMKDLFTPSWQGMNERFWAWLQIVARIKPGMTLARAEAGTNVFYRQVLAEEAKALSARYTRRQEFLNDRLDLMPIAAGMRDQTADQRAFFLELMAIGGVVLAIACVNLAGLLMARTTARQRELAIRLALGAGRFGVVRQLLTENLLLAAAGGALGVLLAAQLAAPAVRFLVSPDAYQLIDSSLDMRVLLFALAVTTFTAVAFALLPPLQMRHTAIANVLKTESGASSSRSQVRLRKVMVTVQLAFCVWLTIAAGLFARSLAQLRSVDLGFRKEHLITFQLDAMGNRYPSDRAVALHRQILQSLESLPGVTAVGYSDYGVLTNSVNLMFLQIEGYRPPPPDTGTSIRELLVSPGYMQAVGTPIVAGRDFTVADLQKPVRSAIVNEAFARKYFGGANPVGRRIGPTGPPQPQWEIVGMVRNQRYDGPGGEANPFYYVPVEQDGRLSFYVRVSQAPEAMTATIARVVGQLAPGVPVFHLRTMDEMVDLNIGNNSRIAMLAGFFALLATLLAAIGLYGVMAYNVTRRTREIGIRIAIGAARRDVMWLVIREVGIVIAGGLVLGLPTGLAVARVIQSQLYNVSPMDAASAEIAAAAVASMALIAGFLPARRATRIDPVRALRWE